MTADSTPRGADDPRDLLERLTLETLREKRRARRWGIFFKLFFVAYLTVVLWLAYGRGFEPAPGPHTAMIRVDGVIGADADIDADQFGEALRVAFESDDARGVVIQINSPGGSAVHAGRMFRDIRRLRAANPDKPVFAVISDIGASGGYYVAAAADEIYADAGSLVGSIGVVIDGFGFVETMEKLGVERRMLTAGERKGLLDPFSPVSPADYAHARALLAGVHSDFIEAVKIGRGPRLATDQDIFSGLVWNGLQARELGLVDGLGDARFVASERVGQEDVVDYTPRGNLFDEVRRQLGVTLRQQLSVPAPAIRFQWP